MKKQATKQYTLRNIPQEVDRVLKQRALESGKSFNQVAIEALAEGAQVRNRARRNLSDIAGTLSAKEAKAIGIEIKHQHQIDPELWK